MNTIPENFELKRINLLGCDTEVYNEKIEQNEDGTLKIEFDTILSDNGEEKECHFELPRVSCQIENGEYKMEMLATEDTDVIFNFTISEEDDNI